MAKRRKRRQFRGGLTRALQASVSAVCRRARRVQVRVVRRACATGKAAWVKRSRPRHHTARSFPRPFEVPSRLPPTFVRTYDREPTRQPYALGCYQFSSGVKPCPICAIDAGHQSNQYYVLYTDAERRVFNFSDACCRSGRPMRWTDEGRRRWTAALAGTPDAAVPAALAAAVPSPPSGAEPPGELPAELSFFRQGAPSDDAGDATGRHVSPRHAR
jgi:hypothetical protein